MTIARSLGRLQRDHGLPVDPEENVKLNLNFGLVDVVYEWARGVPFCEITQVCSPLPRGVHRGGHGWPGCTSLKVHGRKAECGLLGSNSKSEKRSNGPPLPRPVRGRQMRSYSRFRVFPRSRSDHSSARRFCRARHHALGRVVSRGKKGNDSREWCAPCYTRSAFGMYGVAAAPSNGPWT